MESRVVNYKHLTDLQHVLNKTEMYIGGPETKQQNEIYIYDVNNKCFVFREIEYSPAWYKSIDEILVNAIDHWSNFVKKVDEINISIDKTGLISIMNTGPGIPQTMFKSDVSGEVMYLPQALASLFKMGGNMEKSEQRITGGTNGLGMKLTNVFSSYFKLETITKKGNKYKKYTQIFRDRLSIIEEPLIEDVKECQEYTLIEFMPCYDIMGYKKIEAHLDILTNLLYTRALHVYAFISNNVVVKFNEEIIQLNGNTTNKFINYSTLYLSDKNNIYHFEIQHTNKLLGWDICIGLSDGKFRQSSIINGIHVSVGGTHIKYLQKIILDYIKPKIEKKLSSFLNKKLNNNIILNNMFIIFKSFMINPKFSSQAKTEITTDIKSFHDYIIKKKDLDAIYQILEPVILQYFINKTEPKNTKHIKHKRVHIENGEDAKYAGTTHFKKTSLIICEGNSAMSTMRQGISDPEYGLSPEYYGTFSIQGVPVNARKEIKTLKTKNGKLITTRVSDKMFNNEKFKDLVKMLGLDYSKKYINDAEFNTLRYGRVIIAVDQDVDGKGKIFGLILNFFAVFWPELIECNYIKRFNTPVIRAYPKKSNCEILEFYNTTEYGQWIDLEYDGDESRPAKLYDILYFKGLGTHDNLRGDISLMFNKFENCLIDYTMDKLAQENFNIYYGKDPSLRKQVLSTPVDIELTGQNLLISDFLHSDVKEYQRDDVQRSLPNLTDGLTIVRRKILFAGRKIFGNNNKMMKVCDFAGNVSDMTQYHHGDASITESIVKMCQDFPGARNFPLFIGIGQFGSRKENGADHAAARYINIKLNKKLTYAIYPAEDDFLLTYEFFDGKRCEPSFYIPVIPMSILEDMPSLGTGWRSVVWARYYLDVIKNVRDMINDTLTKPRPMKVWLRGLNISIKTYNKLTYAVGKYKYDKKTNILTITELPPNISYKKFIQNTIYSTQSKHSDDTKKERLKKSKEIIRPEFTGEYSDKSFYDKNTNTYITNITLELQPGAYDKIMSTKSEEQSIFDPMEQFLNLKCSIKSELNYIDQHNCVREFKNYSRVMLMWFEYRKEMYGKRIDRMIIILRLKIMYYENLIRFVNEKNKYNITSKTTEKQFNTILSDNKYLTFNKEYLFSPQYMDITKIENFILYDDDSNYNYIMDMRQRDTCREANEKRKTKLDDLKIQLNELLESVQNDSFKGKQIWLRELENIEQIIEQGLTVGWRFIK